MPLVPRILPAIALVFVAIPMASTAQISTPRPPHTVRPMNRQPRQEPCWQEAGISKGAMEQRRSLEQSARAEIQSVCANSSLTPQQRREQIRTIRERTHQQVDTLVSPQQREALRACQESRRGTHPGGGGGFHGGGGHGEGPCGELNESKEPREGPKR